MGYQRLNELGTNQLEQVVTAGGGAVNETWRRIRQRYLKVPILHAKHGEAAYGAARLAQIGPDLFSLG
jgi:sugar (pentulose or hexulose) kinase